MPSKKFSCHTGSTAIFFLLLTGLLSFFSPRPLSAKEPVLSACETNYPPFCIVEDDGRATGFSVDLLNAALRAMGRDVTYETGPWAEVKSLLEQGKIDALPLVGRTPERESTFDFTFPYLSLHGAIVVREGTTNIFGVDDLIGKRIGVMEGDNAEEFLRRSDLEFDIHTTVTFEEALRDLSEGKFDAVIIQHLLALRIFQETGISNLDFAGPPLDSMRQDFCFAVQESDGETLSLLNEGLALVMADGTFSRLQTKWFAPLELPADNVITVGTELAYPPFSFLDENGKAVGYNVDLIQAVAKAAGKKVEVRIGQFGDIRKALETGEIDAIAGVYYSAARDEKLDFSPPFNTIHQAIFIRTNSAAIKTEEDLRGKDIIVMRGDIMHDYIMEKHLCDTPVLVESQSEALRLLSSGKHDCAIVGQIPGLFWINKLGLANLVKTGPPLMPSAYCFAVKEGNTTLQQLINEGLKVVSDTGEHRGIHARWLGVLEPQEIPFRTVLKYIAFAVIPLILLLAILGIWSRTLKKQVALRTEDLNRSQANLRAFLENARDFGVFQMHLLENEAHGAQVSFVSSSISNILGIGQPQEDFSWLKHIHEEDADKVDAAFHTSSQSGQTFDETFRLLHPQKQHWRWLHVVANPVKKPDGTFTRFNGLVVDVTIHKHRETEHLNLQRQMQHAQKLESLGVLAGGIAHDFNNILMAVLGYSDLALLELPQYSPVRDKIKEISNAAKRAAGLAQQMLAYSGKGRFVIEPINLNEFVKEMTHILQITISKKAVLNFNFAENLPAFDGDANQIRQIIMNLITNASEAVGDNSGVIALSTGAINCDRSYLDSVSSVFIDGVNEILPEGIYVYFEITDSGCGMEKDVIDKIFDPFFTTKFTGRGLGMAAVQGIVRGHSGAIKVYSEVGIGTTFKVLFPVNEQLATISDAKISDEKVDTKWRGSGTVLIVDDEETVCAVGKLMLERCGFDVLTAKDGREALDVFNQNKDKIECVLLDLTMPHMNGEETFHELRRIKQDIKVVLCSGYNQQNATQEFAGKGLAGFIQKPYQSDVLIGKIRQVLE
jgi:ABC-type amino acid transport substrate-binding protein/signal transduction histidine kinase